LSRSIEVEVLGVVTHCDPEYFEMNIHNRENLESRIETDQIDGKE